jgi:hypothetical protein
LPPSPASPRPRSPEETRELNRRVWDLVLNLVHPAAIYVCIQIAVSCHLWQSPLLSDARSYGFLYYGLFLAQYLGAWGAFYSTLLRDAGIRSYAAVALVGSAGLGLAVQLWRFPEPRLLTQGWLTAFLLWQVVPALIGWAWTFVRWRRAKRRLARVLPELRRLGGTP